MAYYYQEEFLNEIAGGGLYAMDVFDSTGHTTHAEGVDKINDSIYNILSTRVGERFMVPEFGSQLHKCVFEPNTAIFRDLAEFYIRQALERWEKRIQILAINVKVLEFDNIVPIEITYRIANTNMTSTFVYPFNVNSSGNPASYEQGTYTISEV